MFDLGFRWSFANGYLWWLGFASQKKLRYYTRFNPHTRILEQGELEDQHLERRRTFPELFEEGENAPKIFLMDNSKGSYVEAIINSRKKRNLNPT